MDPSKSALEVFVGYSEAGPWIPVSNKSVILGAEAGVDVTGKTLYDPSAGGYPCNSRYTPELEMLAWEVSQPTDIDLDNHGPANADAIFTGRVNATNYLQIVHIQTGDRFVELQL